jgi:phosphate:Na+ symporter
MLFQLLGGIGLFLMGMILLTDGLKAFAGEALRKTLIRFTGSPLKALGSGALLTAVVQSSSATTVTVIGFVSAGLLTFSQSVGVVIGASLGTTTTGWVVAVLGLKVSIGYYALPLVGVGAFLRLLARGRWKSFGWSVAGFGFIFIGIETLQTGMTGLASYINVANLPQTGLLSHFLAMVIGIVMTIVMQSSSAAVATTLTALHTGQLILNNPLLCSLGQPSGPQSLEP